MEPPRGAPSVKAARRERTKARRDPTFARLARPALSVKCGRLVVFPTANRALYMHYRQQIRRVLRIAYARLAITMLMRQNTQLYEAFTAKIRVRGVRSVFRAMVMGTESNVLLITYRLKLCQSGQGFGEHRTPPLLRVLNLAPILKTVLAGVSPRTMSIVFVGLVPPVRCVCGAGLVIF